MLPKYLKKNKTPSGNSASQELIKVQKNIFLQASLAFLTIGLTVVILFAMTAAWQTNIAQSSGLTFTVEPWGIEGEIKIDETPIDIAPGEEGVIGFEMKNNSESISEVNVSVSKKKLSHEMQKRLFFYVETPMTVDTSSVPEGSEGIEEAAVYEEAETVERVYISDSRSYTYTVFNKGSLIMNETISNAPRLKWHWVYDVLGYYVLGKEVDGTVTVSEYLRPIEYNYDKATTEIKEEGDSLSVDITTVDGVNPPDAFMAEVSLEDGYPGYVDSTNPHKTADGYYVIDVDENGYGVYAYLCDYSQIESEINWDTKTGEVAYRHSMDEELSEAELKRIVHTASLQVSAQKMEVEAQSVSTLDALREAVNSGDAEVIQLTENITISDGAFTVPEGRKVMIDLNGKTITSELTSMAFIANKGSSVTMINGDLVSAKGGNGFSTRGAELVLSNVEMSGFPYCVFVEDDMGDADSNIYLANSKINGSTCAILVYGNGTKSEQKSRLTIEKCEITSENGTPVAGNGSYDGTDIQIIDSTITTGAGADSAAIYHPGEDGDLVIYNSTVNGNTAIVIKGGNIEIIDSEIYGTGTVFKEPKLTASGYSIPTDAVYIETNYNYEISLKVINSILSSVSEGSQSLRVFLEDSPYVEISIISGMFDEKQHHIAADSEQAQSGDKWIVTSKNDENPEEIAEDADQTTDLTEQE